MSFAYVVRVAFDDDRHLEPYLKWLVPHADEVCRVGNATCEIVRLDGVHALEARYTFADRAAFEAYERDHAPRLRADGIAALERFGLAPGRGVVFTRTTGEILQAAARAR